MEDAKRTVRTRSHAVLRGTQRRLPQLTSIVRCTPKSSGLSTSYAAGSDMTAWGCADRKVSRQLDMGSCLMQAAP